MDVNNLQKKEAAPQLQFPVLNNFSKKPLGLNLPKLNSFRPGLRFNQQVSQARNGHFQQAAFPGDTDNTNALPSETKFHQSSYQPQQTLNFQEPDLVSTNNKSNNNYFSPITPPPFSHQPFQMKQQLPPNYPSSNPPPNVAPSTSSVQRQNVQPTGNFPLVQLQQQQGKRRSMRECGSDQRTSQHGMASTSPLLSDKTNVLQSVQRVSDVTNASEGGIQNPIFVQGVMEDFGKQENITQSQGANQPSPCQLDKQTKILNQLQLMTQNLWDEVLDLRVQAAIQMNKLTCLDNPVVHEKLEEYKRKAHEILNKKLED